AELALIDQREFAGLFDARGRASRRAVEHGHESNRFVWSADLDHFVAYQHLDQAGLDNIHAGARLTLIEDNASGANRPSCAGPLRTHSLIDVIAIHARPRVSKPHVLDSVFMPKTRGRGLALH